MSRDRGPVKDGVIDFLFDAFARLSARTYGSEGVTMVEHMLQTAALAEHAQAADTLVAAALLHDIGHFGTDFPWQRVSSEHRQMLKRRIDRHHEQAGAQLLQPYFGPEITEPIRLHVAAKRYLCAVEPQYLGKLSATTRHTLALQGGPMTASEVAEFEAASYAAQAVSLRRWDEQATVPGMKTPPGEHYRALLERLMRS
jgi:phosphonate degradation associated HDIG domain protein